jgi:hypothetical protein
MVYDYLIGICLESLMNSFKYFSREFTHRVKSVSMAKFSAEEVSALQAGGNEVCIYINL